MKKLLLLFLLFIAGNYTIHSQFFWNSEKDKIKIPFELSNNLIILKVNLNNVDLNMILDTGSDMNILFSYPIKDSLVFLNSRKIKVKGLGEGVTIDAFVSGKNTLKLNEFIDDNFEVLLVTDQDINLINKLGIPIHGIIGKSFFINHLVEINYQNRKLFLHKKRTILKKRKLKSYSHENIELVNEKPYLNFIAIFDENAINLKLLMDTGLGDGLWLFENDSIKCKKEYFEDFLGRGLGGDIKGKRSRVNKLFYKNFSFKDALVSYPDSSSISKIDFVKGRNGSLGGEIIKRFNWFLDFEDQKVYFKKNSLYENPFNYNMSGLEVIHDGDQYTKVKYRSNNLKKDEVKSSISSHITSDTFIINDESIYYNEKLELKPLFRINSVREDSEAFRAGIRKGDVIVSINNKNSYYFTMQKITEVFQSEEGKNITIEIERDGVILKFKFKLKKIL